MTTIISRTQWEYTFDADGQVFIIHFFDHVNNRHYSRRYRTERGARCAETKFHSKVSRYYTCRQYGIPT